MSVMQTTAKTILEVMWFVETTPHHIVSCESETHVELIGHTAKLRVANALWKQCFVKSSKGFDTRSYRWDHQAHRQFVLSQERTPKTRDRFYIQKFHVTGMIVGYDTLIDEEKANLDYSEGQFVVRYYAHKDGKEKIEHFTVSKDDLVWKEEHKYWTILDKARQEVKEFPVLPS